MDPAWHIVFDAFTTVLKWINGTRQESCWQSCAVPPEWDDSWVGQWDRRWVGVNSKRECAVVPFISSLSRLFLSLWFLLTKNRLGDICSLMDLFISTFLQSKKEGERGKLPHSYGSALIVWQKLSLHTQLSWGPAYMAQATWELGKHYMGY